jgi:integrase
MRLDSEAERYPAWPDPATTTLIGLHGKWVINRRPNAETQKAFLSVVKKLVAFIGFDDVSRLTTADVRRWCAALKESGDISDRRIREHYLAAIKAILNSAVTMGYLASNVAAPVKIDVGMEQERRERDLRDGEIYAILRATAGPFEPGLSDDVRAARRWVPWLCAYTGARVAEITRLESRHIIREDGIDGIHIETSKTVRTRKIPIHQDLKDQGFLDFVDARRGQPLFFQESKLLEGRGLTIHRTRAEGVAEWIRRLEGMQEAAVAPPARLAASIPHRMPAHLHGPGGPKLPDGACGRDRRRGVRPRAPGRLGTVDRHVPDVRHFGPRAGRPPL